MLHEFIQNPGKTIEYYCDTINISRSSFARKLKQCNQVLETYSLRVIVDQGYQLTSQTEELPLRIFTTFFFLMYYGHYELPYQLDKQEIKQLMRRNQCQLNIISMDNSYEHDFFIMYFIVDLLREHQGFQQRFQKKQIKRVQSKWKIIFYSVVISLDSAVKPIGKFSDIFKEALFSNTTRRPRSHQSKNT